MSLPFFDAERIGPGWDVEVYEDDADHTEYFLDYYAGPVTNDKQTMFMLNVYTRNTSSGVEYVTRGELWAEVLRVEGSVLEERKLMDLTPEQARDLAYARMDHQGAA